MAFTVSLKTTSTFNILFEELVEIVFDRRDELLPHITHIHEELKFSTGRYIVDLTNWHKTDKEKDDYICVSCTFDVNDPQYLRLKARQGYMYDDGVMMDTDGFLTIKGDRESLTQAVAAILNGTIPLHNRNITITPETCPYALLDW
jgi:hypothetical protein